MSRVYTSTNDPMDFCRKCFPAEEAAKKMYGDLGDGPDGRGNCFGWDAEHPDYQGEDYRCVICGTRLRSRDNYHTE